MKTNGANYNYSLKLWRFDETSECSATIIRFNSYFRVIFHGDIHEPKEKDFSELNNVLLYLIKDCGYHFFPGSVHLKPGSLE